MKYKAIIETDEFEDFGFFEDGNGKYLHAIDTGSVNGEWIALYFTECKEEPVLDKIKAEIKALSNANPSYWHSGDMVDRDEVLEVLDKYREESEEDDEY